MTMEDENERIKNAAEAIHKIERFGRKAEFTLANGIVLSIKAVPPMILTATARDALKYPDPPVKWNEERQRDEPNPNDPDYQDAMRKVEAEAILTMRNLAIALGTEVKSLPEGYFPPEADDWFNAPAMQMAVRHGLKLNTEDPIERYLAWMLYYAIEDYTDLILAERLVNELGTLRRDEVDAALESFRGVPAWPTDNGRTAEVGHSNGDRTNRASRRAGARNRGT